MREEVVPQYISPEKFSKMSGLGIAEIKKKIEAGEIEGTKTEGGHYKVIIRNALVSREKYEQVVRENERLKEKLKTINLTSFI